MIQLVVLVDLGVQAVYNFTEKQSSLLESIKTLLTAQRIWSHDPIGRAKIEAAKESVQALLVYNIGTKIVQDGLNKETNG